MPANKYHFDRIDVGELRFYRNSTVKDVHRRLSDWRKQSGEKIKLRCRQAGSNVFAKRVD